MSPFSTLNSCGNSSSLVRRRKRPVRVIRESPAVVIAGPVRSLPTAIVRNLYRRKVLPCWPTRSATWKTGPGESSFTRTPMTARIGLRTVSPTADATRSNPRLLTSPTIFLDDIQHSLYHVLDVRVRQARMNREAHQALIVRERDGKILRC